MKTITIEIYEDSINVTNTGEINRQDFKYMLDALIEKFGNQIGAKRTVNEKMALDKQKKIDKTEI